MNAALRSPEPDNDADPVDDSRTVNDVECTSSREVILDLAEAWVLPVVLDLDGAHSELTGETWCPPPSDRWHRLAEDFLQGARAQSSVAPDASARSFLVSAAAFLLAECADLDGLLASLRPGRRTEEIRGQLQASAHRAEHAAASLLSRVEEAGRCTWRSQSVWSWFGPAPEDALPPTTRVATDSTGWRGRHPSRVAVREARRLVASVGEAIDKEEALGSLRHRRVSTAAKVLSLICVLAIDLPITLWLSIAVVGLDRARPDAGAVAVCVVAALVATAGVAILPYQLGHDHRTYKTPERQLRWTAMPLGAKAGLAGATLLIAVMSAAVLVVVVRSGAFAGQDLLVQLIATVVVFALPVSAGMAFWLAFRDGSPECDALERSSRYLLKRLQRARRAEDCSGAADRRLRLVRCRDDRERRVAQLDQLATLAARTLDEPVLGPRGHLLSVAEADRRRRALEESLTSEAAGGSRRHDRVHAREKVLRGLVPALVDVPILLAVPLALSGPGATSVAEVAVGAVVAVIMASGIALGLRHVGRDQREAKGADGRLCRRGLGIAARANLVGVGLLTVLLASAVLVSSRILLELWLASGLVWLIAIGAALVLPVTVASMLCTAFRDGSPETDDAASYARAVEPHLRLRQELLAGATTLRAELALPPARSDAIDPVTVSRAAALLWNIAGRGIERLTTPPVLLGVSALIVAAMVAPALWSGVYGPGLPFATILAMTLVLIGRAWRNHRRLSSGGRGQVAGQVDLLPRAPTPDGDRVTGPAFPTAVASRQAAPNPGQVP